MVPSATDLDLRIQSKRGAMTFDIRQVTVLTESDRQRLFGWGADIFGVEHLQLSWRPNRDWRFILLVDTQPVSHVAVLKHSILVADQPLRVGGIGGVVTIPHAQGQGYAQALLDRVEQFLCGELHVDFGFLFCRDRLVPFYAQRGWQPIANLVCIDQPAGSIDAPLPVMVYPCQGEAFPAGTVVLNSLPW
jgi:GNAT superfamily N-acetyltransferase